MKPLVFIQMLNYKGLALLKETLPLLLCQDYCNLKIQLIDNGSTDGSIEFVKNMSPDIIVIENQYNIGLAAARNIGFQYAIKQKADYVLSLDNDTYLFDPALITKLIEKTLEPGLDDVFAFGLVLKEGAGFKEGHKGIDLFGGTFNMRKNKRKVEGVTFVDFVPGCFMFIRCGQLKKTGLIDEGYYIYFEEVDLSLRAWGKGMPSVLVDELQAGHLKTATNVRWSAFFTYFYIRNFLFVSNRFRRFSERPFIYRCMILKRYLVYCLESVKGGIRSGAFFINLSAIIAATIDWIFDRRPVRFKLK